MKQRLYTTMIRLAASMVLLFSVFHSYAQIYPVQVTVVTTPPYYNYLAHYGDQNNHLQVIATFTDFAAPPVNVRLRLTIEGAGFVVRTRQDIPVGQLYTLSPGVPVFIQGSDILPYLTENSLELVSGSVDLENLPEGFTTICVEAIKDGINGEALSDKSCTAFFLQYMQPPQPFLPICNSTVDTTQLFQTFQWSPPQNYLPSVGSDLTYNFSLYEWIDTTNYNIFQSGQGLVYQTQTTFPMVQVSNFDVLWQNGRKYVWRVQAQLTSNGLPVQMFTQNGLSAPCSFYYGQAQSLAEQLTGGLTINVTAEALASRKGRALWTVTDETPGEGLSNYTAYIVEYRRKPYEGENYIYNWLYDTVYAQQQPIWRLEPEETYQVRVSGIAGDFVSEPSDIVEFTTPPLRDYACGEADLPYLPANYSPLLSAHMGDVFQIGQFELEVTYIEPLGQTGHFKGRGVIKHDFIGGAKVKVKFDDLLVDNQYVVREGMATAVTKGVDDWLNEEYLDLAGVDTTVQGVIESGGFVNDSTVFVVVNGDSLFFEFDGVLPIVIHDQNNVEYQFWPDGTMIVTNYGLVTSADSLNATKDLFVYFEPVNSTQEETATLDRKQYAQFSTNYEAIECQALSNQQSNAPPFVYFVSNKSKSTTGTAQVKAVIHGTIPNFQVSELKFRIAGQTTLLQKTQVNDSTFIVTLPEQSSNYNVYAYYTDDFKYGKLNVKSYAPVTRKVRVVPLVPVSGITEQQIEAGLNAMYKGANLNMDITLAPQFNTPTFTATTVFTSPDVEGMSKYTAQMRDLRQAYLESNTLESGEQLVFIIPQFANEEIDGYMVRGRGLGFITQSTLSNITQFTRTLAHELGHGMGGLQHAWFGIPAGEPNNSLKGQTNNLMDYAGGNQLVKGQWEALRNPGLVISLLDSEEDGSNYTVSGGSLATIYSSFANADGTLTFVDPSGRKITIPAGVTEIVFASPDSYWEKASGEIIDENETPIGALLAFKKADGVKYNAHKNSTSNYFTGYYSEGQTANLYRDTITPVSQINHILAGIPCIINGNVKFKICPLNREAILQNGTNSAPIGGTLIPEERFNFINSYLTTAGEAQGIEVVATFSTQLSNQVLQYLQSVRSNIVGKEAVYAFEVAYLLQTNKIVGNCIAGINNAVNLVIDAEHQEQLIIEEQANFNEFHTQASDNTAIQVNTANIPMNIYSIGNDPTIFQPTIEYGSDPEYFRKYYYTLANWISHINKQVDYTKDALTNNSIDIGAYSDFLYKNLRSDQRECYLSSLRASQRIKILREYSEFTWGSAKERLFLEVLETTPEDQYTLLLNAFREDNFSLLKGLNGDLWNGDNYRLFLAVSLMALKDQEINYNDLPTTLNLQKPTSDPNSVSIITNWTSAGSIRFAVHWQFENAPDENDLLYFDPFELVTVKFHDDYQFAGIDGGQIHEDDRCVVPAMFAYWLIKEQDKIEETRAIRIILDLGAIALSVASANPGPFLIADAAFAAIDLTFAATEDEILSSGTAKQKELLNNWNMLATVVGVANGVYLVQKVTVSALKFTYDKVQLANRIKYWKNANSINDLESMTDALKKLYKNSQSNLFTSGYNTMKQELSYLMRETEINRLLVEFDNPGVSLSLAETGGQNTVRFTYTENGIENTVDLCYLDPDNQGRMVFSTMQFADNNPTLIDKVLMVLDDVNYAEANGEMAFGRKLSVVKTKEGFIKICHGSVDISPFGIQKYRIDRLKELYGNLDFEGFNTIGGLDPNNLPQTIIDEMISELQYRKNLPATFAWDDLKIQAKVNELISSGSNIPTKRTINVGEKLYKIVPKGNLPSPVTEYWVTQNQLNELMTTGISFEKQSGLPLGSYSVEYDIFEITSVENTFVFESTIAPTNQRGYESTGGAIQSLVLNRAKWSNPQKINTNTFIPVY